MPALFCNGQYQAWVYEWDLDVLGEARACLCERTPETLTVFAATDENHKWPFGTLMRCLRAENKEAQDMLFEVEAAEALVNRALPRIEAVNTVAQVLHVLTYLGVDVKKIPNYTTAYYLSAAKAEVTRRFQKKWSNAV